MRHFFDPSLLPITVTDLDGNSLYVRTNGLNYYGYPDIIIDEGGEEAEQLLLDILDRIFSLKFNINSTWSYNGKIIKLEINAEGNANIVYPKIDEARVITILNPATSEPIKYKSKGLFELYNHPEVEVNGNTLYGKDILEYLLDQVKGGAEYNNDSVITYEEHAFVIHQIIDRLGNPYLEIQLQLEQEEFQIKTKTHKRAASHLTRVK